MLPASVRLQFRTQLKSGPVTSPISLPCCQCHQEMPSNLVWRCGDCGHENHQTDVFSFFNCCEKCRRAPSGIVCPTCEQPTYFRGEVSPLLLARVSKPLVPIPSAPSTIRVKKVAGSPAGPRSPVTVPHEARAEVDAA